MLSRSHPHPTVHPTILPSWAPSTDLRLRNGEDTRGILCEAQEAAMPEIQEQIHDYRLALLPSPLSSLSLSLRCVYGVGG